MLLLTEDFAKICRKSKLHNAKYYRNTW